LDAISPNLLAEICRFRQSPSAASPDAYQQSAREHASGANGEKVEQNEGLGHRQRSELQKPSQRAKAHAPFADASSISASAIERTG
jgi:hypothetical protein